MEARMEIRKFAAFVILEYSNLMCSQDDLIGGLGDFKKDDNYKEIFESIKLLLKLHGASIYLIKTETSKGRKTLSSKRKYLEYLVARCLKLSEDDVTFFEFLLVCVYIAKTASRLFEEIKCCKLLKVTADCVEAVYCRKYWHCFVENDGFLGFSKFCGELNESVHSVEFKNGECKTFFLAVEPKRNEKVGNFMHLKDATIIGLNDLEVKLLDDKDKEFFKPDGKYDEDFLIHVTGVTEDARDPDMAEWEVVPEKAVKTGIRCSYCKGKCFQYSRHLAETFPRCKNVSGV